MADRRRMPRTMRTLAKIGTIDSDASALDRAVAADMVLRHLFVPPARSVDGVRYAAYYRFAEKHSGGDLIDVYRCSDGDANFSLTDISGKGVTAALHAGLVKYGIRAYATEHAQPRDVLRWLNRFYCETDAFEENESFASVFMARYDPRKRVLSYASAGHDGVFVIQPRSDTLVLMPPTGPVVGVLPDSPHLYTDRRIDIEPGATLVAVSDGVYEARREGELFGMKRLQDAAVRLRHGSLDDLACGITREAAAFGLHRVIDDMAVLAVTFE